jgi:hypothetical protein
MRKSAGYLAALLTAVLMLTTGLAEAQTRSADVPEAVSRAGHFYWGAGLGLMGGTVDGETFALGGNLDYYFTHELSVGPLLQMGITGDLFQPGLSGQVKYMMDVRQIPALKPHVEAGIGFIYANLDRARFSNDDVSFLIPLGFGLEYRFSRRLSLNTTVYLNFTSLDPGKHDNFFTTWLIGARFPF